MDLCNFCSYVKKQVATPLLSAKPSVSVPEVSTSDSKCALRKSVVSARNNNPRWEVRGWVVRDNKLRAKQCNKFVDFVIFVWDKNKPRWMKTFKAHTKYTKLTKSTRCACAASGMRIFFETEEHKNRLYICNFCSYVKKTSRYALAPIQMQTLGKADTREFTMRESVPSVDLNNPPRWMFYLICNYFCVRIEITQRWQGRITEGERWGVRD